MTPEEVADKLGIDPSGLHQYGNGYAIVDDEGQPVLEVVPVEADSTEEEE